MSAIAVAFLTVIATAAMAGQPGWELSGCPAVGPCDPRPVVSSGPWKVTVPIGAVVVLALVLAGPLKSRRSRSD